jgi:hypothetical protein
MGEGSVEMEAKTVGNRKSFKDRAQQRDGSVEMEAKTVGNCLEIVNGKWPSA